MKSNRAEDRGSCLPGGDRNSLGGPYAEPATSLGPNGHPPKASDSNVDRRSTPAGALHHNLKSRRRVTSAETKCKGHRAAAALKRGGKSQGFRINPKPLTNWDDAASSPHILRFKPSEGFHPLGVAGRHEERPCVLPVEGPRRLGPAEVRRQLIARPDSHVQRGSRDLRAAAAAASAANPKTRRSGVLLCCRGRANGGMHWNVPP